MITPQEYYRFASIVPTFGEDEIAKVGTSIGKRFEKISKTWTADQNSHWSARVFYSAKLILSATVTVNSHDFADEYNLRVVLPYLKYYSILSVVRAVALMIPEVSGNLIDVLRMNHTRAINIAMDHVSKFNSDFGKRLKEKVLLLKAQRELISYSAPSSADLYAASVEDVAPLCRLLAEIAQFNSEYLEHAVKKHRSESSWIVKHSDIDLIATVENEGYKFCDVEDAYRLNYFARKSPRVTNILFSMTEGHTEDFFGAWRAEGRLSN